MTWSQLGKLLGQAVIIIAAVAAAIETIAKGDSPEK
jgi:hypothetical protein